MNNEKQADGGDVQEAKATEKGDGLDVLGSRMAYEFLSHVTWWKKYPPKS